MAAVRLGDVVSILDGLYDPSTAADWDQVGLVCGDPEAVVGKVLFAVDPTAAVVDEAIESGAGLLVTHHPLFLFARPTAAATTWRGRLVHRLVSGRCGLLVVHTNADVARPGVSDALAAALGLDATTTVPLRPDEESAFSVVTSVPTRGRTGLGRVGELLEPTTVSGLAQRAAAALPVGAAGVRASGDPSRTVTRVAVVGGAGDSELDLVRSLGVDAYVTADLRHHPTADAMSAGGPALLDVGHWASEYPWLHEAARLLAAGLAVPDSVEVNVSSIRTDPWTLLAAPEGS
jgi:dinuclear metal center YbgI/SA1388 family protein